MLPTVQVNAASPVAPPLVAVTVTGYVPAVVGLPLITPVAASSDRPGGRPVADQAYAPEPPEACRVRLTGPPTAVDWSPGLVTDTPVPPPALNAAVPFGVPSPVGPSHPVPAWQIGVPQLPLLPLVMSNRPPGLAYG